MPLRHPDPIIRAARRKQNAEIARYPFWWGYWKARHLTWKPRRLIRESIWWLVVNTLGRLAPNDESS